MRSPPPICKTYRRWTADRLKMKHAFAPCTGQDNAALDAFVHLVKLYGYADADGRRAAIRAMSALVCGGMQPSVVILAKKLIPHVLDWGHEDEIWDQIAERIGSHVDELALRRAAKL